MIIIADSGSTKCAWAQCSTNGEILKIHETVGFNPKYTSHNSLLTELENSSLSAIRNQVTEIHFYGAGCSSNEKIMFSSYQCKNSSLMLKLILCMI